MKTQTPKKHSLRLANKIMDNLESSAVNKEICTIICELEGRDINSFSIKVKLQCTHHVIRIMSDHLINDMRYITTHLDQTAILKYAKDMMKSHTALQEVRELG